MNSKIPLQTFQILRKARTEFHNRLCKASDDPSLQTLQKLRHENTFVFTEFYFLLHSFDLINSPDRLETYIRNHNTQIIDLIENPDRRTLMGLEVPRLKRGLFKDEQIEKAVANIEGKTPGLDQADMQRLMIMLFSPETARRVLTTLEIAGFMQRVETPYRSKIVLSKGVIEKMFSKYLSEVHTAISQQEA